jgi:hypothetical protein
MVGVMVHVPCSSITKGSQFRDENVTPSKETI